MNVDKIIGLLSLNKAFKCLVATTVQQFIVEFWPFQPAIKAHKTEVALSVY